MTTKNVKRISVILDVETFDRIEKLREKMGFLKKTEIYRFLIKKGLESVEGEKS